MDIVKRLNEQRKKELRGKPINKTFKSNSSLKYEENRQLENFRQIILVIKRAYEADHYIEIIKVPLNHIIKESDRLPKWVNVNPKVAYRLIEINAGKKELTYEMCADFEKSEKVTILQVDSRPHLIEHPIFISHNYPGGI